MVVAEVAMVAAVAAATNRSSLLDYETTGPREWPSSLETDEPQARIKAMPQGV